MSVSLASWRNAWRELGAASADEALFHQLIACWSEDHRHYHTLQHLRECLAQFEQVRDQAQRPGEVALGLWFHDAFYDTRRHDNELRSAQWAQGSVVQAGLAANVADRVHGLIMATRHDSPPLDADAQLIVDVDLSILGADPVRFDEFDEQIRAEYAHVPVDEYRKGRRAILGGFLARPRLYNTAHFFARLEGPARDNLRRALVRLAE